jgi:serine/threonine protein kinase
MPEINQNKLRNYILEEILGEGGFGVTYRAIDEKNNPVAIKMLKLKGIVSAKAAKYEELFRKEAEFLSQCNHPSIVQVKDLFQEDSGCYMVMEYVEGIDLASLVEENGPLSESQALFYIYQIGEALNVIHQQGFLHRDIKPLNILIRKNSSDAVLIDFGFVQEFQDNEVEIHPEYGSRGFAPIEQYDLRSLRGAYTDVYGLAATLYTLLTAKVPPSATSRDRKIFKGKTDPLVPPKTKNPQISDRVNEAILKGLELQPENRPQSVAEWLKLLGYILETNSQIPTPAAINPWGSAVGIDYSKLQELLTSGKWQEADRETELLMLAISGKEPSGRLTAPDLKNFPCRDLRAIDQLWVESSNGRFGFSVQNRIWQEVEKNYQTFSDRVGWRVGNSWLPYSELQFNPTGAIGHLPTWGRRGRFWPFLASRVRECIL